ncbi:MAG: 3-isopropylmalate dehydrogenase [Parvularculaceae bacterium]
MTFNIVMLPGDGVGSEVAAAARVVLEAADARFALDLVFDEHRFGGAAIDLTGEPFPASTQQACAGADAIFLGAVGGPKWDKGGPRPEAGLLAMRKSLGLFANLRPVKVSPGMEDLSPLRKDRASGVDMVFVRELTGGLYFGDRTEGDERAKDECVYTREEVVRVARVAFDLARKRRGRVTSVDKANVLATSRLWRKTVTALHAAEFADVELEHALVDAMSMKLISSPASFDVILTENLFGDILSDEASVIAGSIGLAPSASLGGGRAAIYEPIHGSAPDIAGQDAANPVGAIRSAAMLLRHSAGAEDAANSVEAAVEALLAAGGGTADIGGKESCSGFARNVAKHLQGG